MSLPQRLREQARAKPSGVALRRKALGIWEETTWAQLDERVARLALGLRRRRRVGRRRGRAGRRQHAGLDRGRPRAAGRRRALRHALAGARRRGARRRSAPGRRGARDLRRRGAVRQALGPAHDRRRRHRRRRFDDARGDRRGRRRRAAGALRGAAGGAVRRRRGVRRLRGRGRARRGRASRAGALLAAAEAVASVTALAPGDRTFCMLPLAALPARVLDVYAALVAGATVHVPESPASVPIDLAEVAPTVLSASPRALELLRASVQVRAARSHGFKRRHAALGARASGRRGQACSWPSPPRGCSGSARRG